MAGQLLLPRLAEPAVEEALADTPVVLVHGPRQCGQTTLTTRLGDRLGYDYLPLDEDAVPMVIATRHPTGFRRGLSVGDRWSDEIPITRPRAS